MNDAIIIDRVLLIREPWISLILSGRKTWEMRTRGTHIRGWVGLSKPGSKLITGVVNVVDCLQPLRREELASHFDKHQVPDGNEFSHYNVPWVLSGSKILIEPIAYHQPPGAVIWVKVPQNIIHKSAFTN